MPAAAVKNVERMRSQLLFDGEERGAKPTRFWALLVLAAIIASAGIVGDSTATVIGAMIVAPWVAWGGLSPRRTVATNPSRPTCVSTR
jgi:hypothetical protein